MIIDMTQSRVATQIVGVPLGDRTRYYHMLIQLHDLKAISTETLFKEIGLDYEKEIKIMNEVSNEHSQ